MRIGLDVDGCLRALYDKLVNVYKRELNGDHWCEPPEKWRTYHIADYFSIGEDIYTFWFKTFAEEIYLYSSPLSGIDMINSLKELGHELIILTDQPNKDTAEYTIKWLHKYVNYDELHFTKNKHLVPCDIYLEDNPSHIISLYDNGKRVVVMNHGWNERLGEYRDRKLHIDNNQFERVTSLPIFYQIILEEEL